MNFTNYGDKNSKSCDEDKIYFSSSNDRSGFEDNSQGIGNGFPSVVIKCEEKDWETSSNASAETKLDLANSEIDSQPWILNMATANEQSSLGVDIKPDPFEIESRVKQESVSDQETGPFDAAIKYEKTEMDCSDDTLFIEDTKIWNTNNSIEQSDFNSTNAKTSAQCDPLATEIYVKQENEICVDPLTCGGSDGGDTDHNNGYDRSVSTIQSEIIRENTMSFRCDVCNKTLNRLSTLERHKRTHTRERSYQCDVCNKSFTRGKYLTIHKRLHTGDKPYKCDVCNKTFNSSSALGKHKITHTGAKPYPCDVCNKYFSQRTALKNHKRLHSGEETYKCDTCDKTYTQASNLRIHKLLHAGGKPYQCEVCNKGFNQLGTLERHKHTHTGEKPYPCDVCDKTFSQSRYLRSHKLTHTGEKPYRCDVCNKAFTHLSNLKVHKLLHTGERPHQCDVCNKAFVRLHHLNIHKRTHAGEKSYKYEISTAVTSFPAS